MIKILPDLFYKDENRKWWSYIDDDTVPKLYLHPNSPEELKIKYLKLINDNDKIRKNQKKHDIWYESI